MPRLSASDLNYSINRLYEAGSVVQTLSVSMHEVARLLPANLVSLSVVDPRTGNIAALYDRPLENFAELIQKFEKYGTEHPIIKHTLETGFMGVIAISEIVPLREFQKTGLWRECYRPMGMVDQAVIQIYVTEKIAMALVLNFPHKVTQRELETLRLLDPHVTRALRNAQQLEDLRRAGNAIGVVIADALGHVLYVSPWAQKMLDMTSMTVEIGHGSNSGFAEWVSALCQGDTGRVEGAAMTWSGLRATVMDAPLRGDGLVVGISGTLDSLRATELAIMRLCAEGLTDIEIAGELSISPRTVSTYLEQIYSRFNLKNRAAAAAWYVRNWENVILFPH